MEKCVVVSESLPDLGFGAATLAAAKYFRLAAPGGEAAQGATVDIPLVWVPPPTSGRDPGPLVSLISVPVWARTPTPDQIKAVFPAAAVGKVDTGIATMACKVNSDGSLRGCETDGESPEFHKFGHAALALATDFKVALEYLGGPPPKNPAVRVTIAFHDPSKPAPPLQITAPVWTRSVDEHTVQALYPAEAAAAHVTTGKGVVSCTVAHSGALINCQAVGEEPAGLGFGEAAVRVAESMALNPWTAQGNPVDGANIRVPLVFNLTPDDPAMNAAPGAPTKP